MKILTIEASQDGFTDISEKIKSARMNQKPLSREKLAKKAGVSMSLINLIETERSTNVGLENLVKIASSLEIESINIIIKKSKKK